MFITHAAIMFSNGEVFEGRDYHHINQLANKIGFAGERILGFLDSTGEFQLPVDAAKIALKAGQITEPVDELTPSDLWPQGFNE